MPILRRNEFSISFTYLDGIVPVSREPWLREKFLLPISVDL